MLRRWPTRAACETRDLTERGWRMPSSCPVSSPALKPSRKTWNIVAAHTHLPILIGSGTTPENLHKASPKPTGFIVGSYFKKGGRGENRVEAKRVEAFMQKLKSLGPGLG